MKKATLIKLLCLALASLLLIPMIVACGETDGTGTSDSTPGQGGSESVNGETVRIEFRLNNSSAVVVSGERTFDVAKGTKLTSAMAPVVSLNGYTLKGWSFTANLSDLWDGSDRVVNSDLVLFAVWQQGSGNTTTGKVAIVFDGNGIVITVGDYIEIDSGAKLTWTDTPTVTRPGYTFKGWAYDPVGSEVWNARKDVFTDAETVLYAMWEKDASTPGGSDTTGSSTPAPGGDTDSSTPGDGGTVNPPVGGTITIEYEVGQGGDFENLDDYEKEVPYGERFREHPTPINSNPAMLFVGWYTDEACTIPVSNSTKYTEDTILYACWLEQAQCTDGSYNHNYTGWDTEGLPSCTTPGTSSRFCSECNDKQIKVGDPAIGHKFSPWTEAFMAKERTCTRAGCGEKEFVTFKNMTTTLLGNSPADQIDGNSEAFYDVPFTNLINNKWDEGHGEFIGPRGTGEAYVQFNLIEAAALDRVYFKGESVTSINIFVQYEGEDEFTLLGICGGVSEKEATPFVEPDPTRKIVSVKFVENNPPQGTSKWQEVAFVMVVEE